MTEADVIRAHTSFNEALKQQHFHELERSTPMTTCSSGPTGRSYRNERCSKI